MHIEAYIRKPIVYVCILRACVHIQKYAYANPNLETDK